MLKIKNNYWKKFVPSKYDLTISSSEGTVSYTVRIFKNDLVFLRVDSIIPCSKYEYIQFNSLDVRIREDFIKTVNPEISEEELLIRLYGKEISDFLLDANHFIYSFDITAQVLNKIGTFSNVIHKMTKQENIQNPSLLEEHRIFEIDDKWRITISIKNGILHKQASILNIIYI